MAEPTDPNKPVLKDLTGRIGKYEIVRPLGKGAMGQVFVAHDVKLDRDVALKVMAAQIADDPELKGRFEREAKAVGKMAHPNLVTVFDFDYHTDGSPYIAMELLKGQDLQKRMRQPPPLTLEEKVGIIVRVLNGLNHAHQAGIVHRDIKPANIFIQDDGSVKIMDFGVAHVSAASMTGTGNVIGTADYMSPEQVQGKRVDGRSDLFAVGCMLFELAAGRRPFHADNLMAIFYKITHDEANFDLIPQGADHDALMPILKKALAKNLEDRYQTAYEFAVDLREWLKANATSASTQNVLEALVLEAPTHAPAPLTEAPGATVVPEGAEYGATVDIGRRGPRKGKLTPTRPGARTAVDAGLGATVRPGATRLVPAPARVPARPRPAPKASVLPWVAMALALVAVGVAGWLAWRSLQAPPSPPATLAAAPVPTPPPTTVATPSAPPVTAAPAPTFEEAAGKAGAQVRAASAAFRAGSYDRSVAAAQQALRDDPENETAKKILAQAMVGQKAAAQVRAADAALARGDLAGADAGAAEALRIAPWDPGAVELSRRIDAAKLQAQRDAEARGQRDRAAKITTLLTQADAKAAAKEYGAAIGLYDQVLELEPGNATALQGKSNARTQQTLAEANVGSRSVAVVHSFVPGKTEARGTRAAGPVPPGFEESAGVNPKIGETAAELPGRILFEASPAAPKAGDHYKVVVFLSNEGSQPIQLASTMTVVTIVDGKRYPGPPLTPSTTTVAPGQKAPVYLMPEQIWKEGTESWTMEIALRTTKGDTYTNALSWK
ncbi:MAG TPA: protein kinase [Vicinamibacteria bacterium]|nr:protein kinase [Vicinamibacteria bacterium]